MPRDNIVIKIKTEKLELKKDYRANNSTVKDPAINLNKNIYKHLTLCKIGWKVSEPYVKFSL